MTGPIQYPYLLVAPTMENAGWMPVLPITLRKNGIEVADFALADSGASTNVLPYAVGVQLGLDRNQIATTLPLGAMLANHPAKPVLLEAVIVTFPPVTLAFAWTRGPVPRTLLDQTTFFMAFDICFFRTRGYFEIQPASAATP